jgi:sRNA-binding regulator protein Hfq
MTERKKIRPESDYYDTLKGHNVIIELTNSEPPWVAKLKWVDTYSLILEVMGKQRLLYKHAIRTIRLADGEIHGERASTSG